MVEWSQFWKDIADAKNSIEDLVEIEIPIDRRVELALHALALFYKQNREEYKKAQYKGKSEDGEKPTEKQLVFARTLKIPSPEAMTKKELSIAISKKTGK